MTRLLGISLALVAGIAVAQPPSISAVVNGASYVPSGLPSYGIAQGSIFVIQGGNLGPINGVVATNAFQTTTLAGSSVSITSGGSTVAALMYYSSFSQINALLPSATPISPTAKLTVTYNNQTSAVVNISVVASNPGVFTISSDGNGAGIVTYPDYSLVSAVKAANCGGPSTACGAANPGDTLTVWATGLGPVPLPDQSGPQPGNMANTPVTVWLGGVKIAPAYIGRSGCCIGEDQVVFVVPASVPTGCAVPLALTVGGVITHNVVIPVANGSRNCTSSTALVPSSAIQQISLSSAPVQFGMIRLERLYSMMSSGGTVVYKDEGSAEFLQFSILPSIQPFVASYFDQPAAGTCMVYESLTNNSGVNSANLPVSAVSTLDVGRSITVSGPAGTALIPVSLPGEFDGPLNIGGGVFLIPGAYTVSAPGGSGAGGFSQNFTIPPPTTLTSPTTNTTNIYATVSRASGLTVTWAGGTAGSIVEIRVAGASDSTYTKGANVTCFVPAAAGTFTIPPSAMLSLSASPMLGPGNYVFSNLSLTNDAPSVAFTATGLTLGALSSSMESAFILLVLN